MDTIMAGLSRQRNQTSQCDSRRTTWPRKCLRMPAAVAVFQHCSSIHILSCFTASNNAHTLIICVIWLTLIERASRTCTVSLFKTYSKLAHFKKMAPWKPVAAGSCHSWVLAGHRGSTCDEYSRHIVRKPHGGSIRQLPRRVYC